MSKHNRNTEKKSKKLEKAIKAVLAKSDRYEEAFVQNTRILSDILGDDRDAGISVRNARAGLIRTYCTRWGEYLAKNKLGEIADLLKSILDDLDRELEEHRKLQQKQQKKQKTGRRKVRVGTPLDPESQKEFDDLFGEEPRRESSVLEKIAIGVVLAIGLAALKVLFGIFMNPDESEMEKRITTVSNEQKQVSGKNVVVDKFRAGTPGP